MSLVRDLTFYIFLMKYYKYCLPVLMISICHKSGLQNLLLSVIVRNMLFNTYLFNTNQPLKSGSNRPNFQALIVGAGHGLTNRYHNCWATLFDKRSTRSQTGAVFKLNPQLTIRNSELAITLRQVFRRRRHKADGLHCGQTVPLDLQHPTGFS